MKNGNVKVLNWLPTRYQFTAQFVQVTHRDVLTLHRVIFRATNMHLFNSDCCDCCVCVCVWCVCSSNNKNRENNNKICSFILQFIIF